jgi:hypothetical protein
MSTEQERNGADGVRLEALKLATTSYGVQIVNGSTETILRRAKEFEQYLRNASPAADPPAPGQDAGNSPDAGPADLRPAGSKLSGSSRVLRGSG